MLRSFSGGALMGPSRVRLAGVAAGILWVASAAAADKATPKPTPPQLAWQEAELGVMFSYDERVFLKKGHRDHARDVHIDPQTFRPARLDMNQWAKTAKALGATVAFYTTSHETGFRFWQSDANPDCLKKLRWRDGKADLVREFVDACRKSDIKPGLFLEALCGANYGIKDGRVPKKSRLTQAEYNRMLEKETEELATRYGEIFEFWWDCGVRAPSEGGPNLAPIIEKHQPGAIFYHSNQRRDVRWAGSESGMVRYPCWSTVPVGTAHIDARARQGDPEGKRWQPAMADVPLRCRGKHIWFWQPGTEHAIAPLADLQAMYYASVGHNATLIVGLTPDPSGLVPAPDAARCKEFGDWLHKTFGGKPLGETSGKGAELTLTIPAGVKTPATHVILQEEIKDGQRVRQFVVEAKRGGGWQKVCSGSCIGHKFIARTNSDARQFRLRVTQSVGQPEIRSFSIR